MQQKNPFGDILQKHETDILTDWIKAQFDSQRTPITRMGMLELSTAAGKLWDGILALPVIGTLDSARAQAVMEPLLTTIMETGSKIAVIDITGVPTVDKVVAQHLMKTVAAARLMGADCIIRGIRPHIAQTIVHLAVDLAGISTKATLADAFNLAMQRVGMNFVSQTARV